MHNLWRMVSICPAGIQCTIRGTIECMWRTAIPRCSDFYLCRLNQTRQQSVNKNCHRQFGGYVRFQHTLAPSTNSPVAICLLFVCIHFFVGSFCIVGSNFFSYGFHFDLPHAFFGQQSIQSVGRRTIFAEKNSL